MKSWQALTDKTAIGLSVVCAVHCLLLPVAVLLLPSVAAVSLDDEAFHRALLVAVLPASLVALTMGCRKHKRYRVYIGGAIGLTILGFTAYLGHDTFGEWGEKFMTIVGASVIAISHLKNHRLCQQLHCH